LLSIHDKDVW